MQIILLEKMSNLGEIGSVIEVKNGYARNFLFPKKKAIRATKENIAAFEKRRAELEKINAEKKAHAETLVEKVNDASVTLIRQAGDDGRLYGSVSVRDIAKAVADKTGVEIESEMVINGGKFKEIGAYEVTIMLHPEVSTKVNLSIARSEEAASA